jgi:hypothetical protein
MTSTQPSLSATLLCTSLLSLSCASAPIGQSSPSQAGRDRGTAHASPDLDAAETLSGGDGTLTIDNATASADYGVDAPGRWWTSSATPGSHGSDYLVAPTEALHDPARFWFLSDVQRCYAVEAWWTEGANRSAAVTWIGRAGDGREVGRATMDQRSGGGQWNFLGEWTFPPGRSWVTLSRWGAQGSFVVADAVRLTPCGHSAPLETTEEDSDEYTPAYGANLAVPYFYQYDNAYEPSATCGVTSTAMAINWWKPGSVTPDILYWDYGKAQAQSPSGISSIYRWEGLYDMWTSNGDRGQIRAHLDQGRPVVVHGFWTSAGHIATIVGYDDHDWIVNDPAGDWEICYGCARADHIRYAIGGAWDQKMSWDGDIWFSVSDTAPI